MTTWKGALLSLPVVAVALGALAVGLIELGRYWGLGLTSLAFLAVPLVLALVYIRWYHRLPYVPPGAPARATSAPLPGVGAEEPFEDPVEEADRFDQASKTGSPPEQPAIVEDDSAADSPSVR
jgi:hypothetical protein